MRKISKVGIIGAGTMGRRIAFSCIIHGINVCLFDIDPLFWRVVDMVVGH